MIDINQHLIVTPVIANPDLLIIALPPILLKYQPRSLKLSNQLASSPAFELEDGNGVNPATSFSLSNWNIS